MVSKLLIPNERQEREARSLVAQIEDALTSDASFKALSEGLPPQVLGPFRRSLQTELNELRSSIEAYRQAADGELDGMVSRASGDIGEQLVVARLSRGWTQKELARRLFLPEQQVQRYESEKYRSISLGNLLRVARTLGVTLEANVVNRLDTQWLPTNEMSQKELLKVVNHAREYGWLKSNSQSDESGLKYLRRAVAEHVGDYGTPSLLRTGLNVRNVSNEWLLLAWKAQVAKEAKHALDRSKGQFKLTEIQWLPKLVKLSAEACGPRKAQELLLEHGILLVIVPAPPGLNLDGAAFLQNEVPVIGLTLRHDREDNFWFTLLHEIAHVILHYRTGLSSGFFDDIEEQELGDLEDEANEFASELLVPSELWSKSPARISKSTPPIKALAKKLSINPSILFGRIRKERNDYRLFSKNVGQGMVRRCFKEFKLGDD